MGNTETYKIRPYARLLAMLGDQLIKNDIVAITELIKNAYDADADHCVIDFRGATQDYDTSTSSEIIISDDGYGMSRKTITTDFLNPATPIKKYSQSLKQSRKGRVSQGEKGIGRFSMLKLGKVVTVFSKEKESEKIHKITFDFANYDDEFLKYGNEPEQVFLDDLSIQYEETTSEQVPENSYIMKQGHGTSIVIQQVKGSWGKDRIRELKKELSKFCSFEINNDRIRIIQQFEIIIQNNGISDSSLEEEYEKLELIIGNKALYKIAGQYDEEGKKLIISYNEAGVREETVCISLIAQEESKNRFERVLKGLGLYRNEIAPLFKGEAKTQCGSFDFDFYIFDLTAKAIDDFGLTKIEKETVQNWGVFLYRDGVRVQPYGTVGDDWLNIDRQRANARANQMFSTSQIIGQIKISKTNNPNLKDKTSREGIMEDSKAFLHLTLIIKTVLAVVRVGLYQPYRAHQKQLREAEREKEHREGQEAIEAIRRIVKDNPQANILLDNLNTTFTSQRNAYNQRLQVVESLAGVGLSVEASSHDLMLMTTRLKEIIHGMRFDTGKLSQGQEAVASLNNKTRQSEELISMIELKMKDLQSLFVSSKQKIRKTEIRPLVDKIKDIYDRQYKRNGINVEYRFIGKEPVCAKLIDAVVYQVFINLFDNALYWLKYNQKEKKVVILFDSIRQEIIFSDNGYGVDKKDAPYIFDAFFSNKGDEGRGLGLYISKRLLNRYNYTIEIIQNTDEKIETGANFRLGFKDKERSEYE